MMKLTNKNFNTCFMVATLMVFSSVHAAPLDVLRLERENMKLKIKEKSEELTSCNKGFTAEGELVLGWTILKDGSSDKFKIAKSVDPQVDACVVNVIKGIKFSEPVNETSIPEYKVVFQKKNSPQNPAPPPQTTEF